MENQSFGNRVKRTSLRVFKITIISLVAIAIIVFSFLYWGTYEDGVMAGKAHFLAALRTAQQPGLGSVHPMAGAAGHVVGAR